MLSLVYGTAFRADGTEDAHNIRVYRFAEGPMAGRAYIGHDTAEIAHVCSQEHALLSMPREYFKVGEDRYASVHPFEGRDGLEYVRTVDVVDFDPGDDPYVLCDYCGRELLRDDERFEAMFGHPITEPEPRTVDPDAIYMVMSNEEHDDDGHPLWWSNADGWVTQESATRFTEAETRTLTLPLSGRWAEVAITNS